MKPTSKILTILSLLVALQITMQNDSLVTSTISNAEQQMPRPNVSDLNNVMKVIKPFIERPFFPQEVASIKPEPNKYKNQSEMSNALLVGPTQRSNGEVDQEPTMYSTVINNHSTVITHPILEPIVNSLPTAGTKQLANGMLPNEEEITKLSPGAYSIPVKIQGGAINDPTLSGYESPNFIHKNEKILPIVNGVVLPDLPINVSTVASDDLKEFTTKLGNAHNKQEKLDTLEKGRKKLEKEIDALKLTVQREIENILGAKEAAVLLHNLSLKYDTEIARKNADLQIADEVTLKKMLKEKVYKEIQGFRTYPQEYTELDKVIPDDIKNVIVQIKQKLS